MNSPKPKPKPKTLLLSPSASTRRRRISSGSDSNSSDFEFWMIRNPSFPPPNLLSADELFVDGVLLPLHLLSRQPHSHHHCHFESEPVVPKPPESLPVSTDLVPPLIPSKRWKDIFTRKTPTSSRERIEEKEKKKEKKIQNRASSAELNMYLWPFSRSRSAGNNVTRPKMVSGASVTRKVSSAPCSRSNSAVDSKSRKWPGSPCRAGVHLGRSSPIWQVRRSGSGGKSSDSTARNSAETRRSKGFGGGDAGKGRVLNMNVPIRIEYRNHLSCGSDENIAINGSSGGGGGAGRICGGGGRAGNRSSGGVNIGSGGGNLFNLRSLFTKKVY